MCSFLFPAGLFILSLSGIVTQLNIWAQELQQATVILSVLAVWSLGLLWKMCGLRSMPVSNFLLCRRPSKLLSVQMINRTFRCQSGAIATPSVPSDLLSYRCLQRLDSSAALWQAQYHTPSAHYSIDSFAQVGVLSVTQCERPAIDSHYMLAAGSLCRPATSHPHCSVVVRQDRG